MKNGKAVSLPLGNRPQQTATFSTLFRGMEWHVFVTVRR